MTDNLDPDPLCPPWCHAAHESEVEAGAYAVHEQLLAVLPSGDAVVLERCAHVEGVRVGAREPIGLRDVEVLLEVLAASGRV